MKVIDPYSFCSLIDSNSVSVLQLEPEVTVEQIKKKYRSLSFLVHPDKNSECDREKAQQAFEVVNKAYKALENEVTRKKCLDVYQEAKDRTDLMVILKWIFHKF